MAEHWRQRRERGSRLAILLLAWIARRLGRRIARLILHPVVAYYLLAAPGARAASRGYLRRVLRHEPGWRDVYRHLYCFATSSLDQLYIHDGDNKTLSLSWHGYDAFDDQMNTGQGAILVLAHLGSFGILRGRGTSHVGARLRVLMDRDAGALTNAVFEAIDPELRERVIDTSQDDVDRVLKVKAALDEGALVGMMGDRCQSGDRVADCEFLGSPAPFPLTPWLLAGLTRVPVLLVVALHRGGNHYALHFEKLCDAPVLPRAERNARMAEYAQSYADRLAHYARIDRKSVGAGSSVRDEC